MPKKTGWKPKAVCALGGIVIGSALSWHWYAHIRPVIYGTRPFLLYVSAALLLWKLIRMALGIIRNHRGRKHRGQDGKP